MKAKIAIGIIGGAAGVGKTSVIGGIKNSTHLSTGDYFKSRMSLANRDTIRDLMWSDFESLVADDVQNDIIQLMRNGEHKIILDTHFAAKLSGRNYRIGMERRLLHSLAVNIFQASKEIDVRVFVKICLIYASPYDLLKRRKNDLSRHRELIPSDCITSLERNEVCVGQYYGEFVRANKNNDSHEDVDVKIHRLLNDDLDEASKSLDNILRI